MYSKIEFNICLLTLPKKVMKLKWNEWVNTKHQAKNKTKEIPNYLLNNKFDLI